MKARVRIVALLVAFVIACGPVSSHGGPTRDHVSLIDNLRARGLRVEPVDRVSFALLTVPGTLLGLSGDGLRSPTELRSFAYDDTDLGRDGRQVAEEDARRISSDGGAAATPNGPVTAQYRGNPHFYRRERVIVLYVGDDAAMIRVLRDLVGDQFAGR